MLTQNCSINHFGVVSGIMIKKGSFSFRLLGPCLKRLFAGSHFLTIMAYIGRRTTPNPADWSTVTRLFGVLIPSPIRWRIGEMLRRKHSNKDRKRHSIISLQISSANRYIY